MTIALVRSKVRVATYAAMASTSLVIFLGGLTPLFIQDGRALNLIGFYGVLSGAAPLLLMRTRFFETLVTTSPAGSDHLLARWHSTFLKLLVLGAAIATLIMIWRASESGLPGWKTGFLLFYGMFFFYIAGWPLRAPRFISREPK